MPIIFDWMDIYKNKARLWKQAAKKWRKTANEIPSVGEFMHYKTRAGKAELKATCLSKAETRLRGLVDLVNKYSKSRDIADRKAMFALAKELKDGGE